MPTEMDGERFHPLACLLGAINAKVQLTDLENTWSLSNTKRCGKQENVTFIESTTFK